MNDEAVEATTAEPVPPPPSPQPAADPAYPFGRLRAEALAVSGYEQWVVDGAAVTYGWSDETALTKTDFNAAIEKWLRRPVKAEGATDNPES